MRHPSPSKKTSEFPRPPPTALARLPSSLCARTTSASPSGGSATRRTTAGTTRTSPRTAVSARAGGAAGGPGWGGHPQPHPPDAEPPAPPPPPQTSSSAAQDSFSARPASAQTPPSSVTGTMTARTTVTRPTAVRAAPPLPSLGSGGFVLRSEGKQAQPSAASRPEPAPLRPAPEPSSTRMICSPLLPQTSMSACPVSSSAPTPTAVSPASSAATGRTTAETGRTRGTAVSAAPPPRRGGKTQFTLKTAARCS